MFKIFPISGGVCASDGFFASALSAGLKPNGANDVAFIYSNEPCQVAHLLTTNKVAAAPIRQLRRYGKFQTNFVLINAKNANAMTGDDGLQDIDILMEQLQTIHTNIVNPIMSSTGVIGVKLPKEKIASVFPSIDLNKKESNLAAKAIMTTDRWEKEIAFRVVLEDESAFHIGAIAKGAGMINPAMATMLCFITTDAAINDTDMKLMLDELADDSFNAISVDGDTSTNDTVLLLANQKSKVYDAKAFKEALKQVMHYLALQMVKDGEGATKLVGFEITGAKNKEDAKKAAKALANSMLMKTAIFGEDPNWGRVAAVVGASGAECCESNMSIKFGDVVLFSKGTNCTSIENEKKANEVMKKDEFRISCDLGMGHDKYTAYGCDLGYEYVKINADYRT